MPARAEGSVPIFRRSFPQQSARSLETFPKAVLKRGVALAGVDMLRNRSSNYFRYREIFDARYGFQSFRLVSGEPDGHGFDRFHISDWTTKPPLLSSTVVVW